MAFACVDFGVLLEVRASWGDGDEGGDGGGAAAASGDLWAVGGGQGHAHREADEGPPGQVWVFRVAHHAEPAREGD